MYSLHRDVYFQNFELSCVKCFQNFKSRSAEEERKKRVCCVRNAAVQTSGSNRPSVCLHACLVAYLRRRRRVQQNQFSIVFIYTHTNMLLVCLCVHCVDMRGEGKERGERREWSISCRGNFIAATAATAAAEPPEILSNFALFFIPPDGWGFLSLSFFFFTFQFVHWVDNCCCCCVR